MSLLCGLCLHRTCSQPECGTDDMADKLAGLVLEFLEAAVHETLYESASLQRTHLCTSYI